MDDTTKLVSELQSKLAELDGKVANYIRDMALEFQRYSDQLLQDVPADISTKVTRVIAESLSDYPALNPALQHLNAETATPPAVADPDAADVTAVRNGRVSPPPVLPHTSGTPKDAATRGPHDRETEFYGVFTPGYLPLLDSSEQTLRSPPISPQPTAAASASIKMSDATQTPEYLQDLQRPTLPKRRGTDTSSISSSCSDPARVRRSALRRSSTSSNKASPRRVRFDFEGEEVLPTSSPQASNVALPQPRTEEVQMGSRDDSDMSSGVLDDIDMSPPRAKKVSSSEKLRALSKMPLEDPAMWTVVNAQAEPEQGGAAVSSASGTSARDCASNVSQKAAGKAPMRGSIITQVEQSGNESLGSPLEDYEEQADDDSSDEEFISMRSSKKSLSSPGTRSPLPSSFGQLPAGALNNMQSTTSNRATASISIMGQSLNGSGSTHKGAHAQPAESSALSSTSASRDADKKEGLDDDELFEFDDEDSVGYPLERTAKSNPPTPYLDDEEPDGEPDEESEPDPEPYSEANMEATYSTSPAIGIQRSRKPPSPPISASIGSYMGRPIMLDVVKDPRILEEAAELGEFDTFVGSVDGRSGVDRSDLNSFRASLSNAQYSGTPRSFSERFAMEEKFGPRRSLDRR